MFKQKGIIQVEGARGQVLKYLRHICVHSFLIYSILECIALFKSHEIYKNRPFFASTLTASSSYSYVSRASARKFTIFELQGSYIKTFVFMFWFCFSEKHRLLHLSTTILLIWVCKIFQKVSKILRIFASFIRFLTLYEHVMNLKLQSNMYFNWFLLYVHVSKFYLPFSLAFMKKKLSWVLMKLYKNVEIRSSWQ